MKGRAIQLTLPKEIAERVETEAKSRGLSLSSYIRMLVFEKIGVGKNEG
jgi:predicted DNA binding CopG/RHH family protein